MNLRPSSSSLLYRAPDLSAGAVGEGRSSRGTPNPMRAAEMRKVAASTRRTLAAPMTAMRMPPTSGPIRAPARTVARSSALTFSIGSPARRVRPGTRPYLPVSPCVLKLERTNTRAISAQKFRTPTRCNRGTAAMTMPLATSPKTLALFQPSRSTTGPPSTAGTTPPRTRAAVSRPVFAALPVNSRTNHGPATMVIMLPACPMAVAVSKQ